MRLVLISTVFVLLFALTLSAQEIIAFDEGNFWSKDKTNITVRKFEDHVRVENKGGESWTIRHGKAIPVIPGDRFRISGQVKRISGDCSFYINAILYDAQKNVVSWELRKAVMKGSGRWENLESNFIVPYGVAAIEARMAGQGAGTVLYKKCVLQKIGRIEATGKTVAHLENPFLKVEFSKSDEAFSVEDKRTGKTWMQDSLGE